VTHEEKVIQYLQEARATDLASINTLTAHIAMTPRSAYRDALGAHLEETRQRERRLGRRLRDVGESRNLVGLGVGAVQGLLAQVLALSKGPVDLLRGSTGAEKLLKNAKDEVAAEGLGMATYKALEHLAHAVDDQETVELAIEGRQQEEAMLHFLIEQISDLTDDVVAEDLRGETTYDVSTTGAAEAIRTVADEVEDLAEDIVERAADSAKDLAEVTQDAARGATEAARGVAAEVRGEAEQAAGAAKETAGQAAGAVRQRAGQAAGAARETAQQAAGTAKETAGQAADEARKVPGVDQAEGEVRGAVADESDLPIANYDSLKAGDILPKLPELSQEDLAKVDGYERAHRARKTVLNRIDYLQEPEPFPGYDQMTVHDVETQLRDADDATAERVRDYERKHKRRVTIMELSAVSESS
jgi:uncharacterized protein YjbJ (UPF0337 family)/ferritin-like metal-binding protein YciE